MNRNPPKDKDNGWHLAVESKEGEELKLLLSKGSEDEVLIGYFHQGSEHGR